MRYSYTYSGPQAAFILSGVCVLPAGVAVMLEDKEHKSLAKNKFVEHLLEVGELTITEVEEPKATGGRRGSGNTKGAKPADAAGTELNEVRAALKDLDIMYADDEALEQLQAKLAQATE
ncbi:hypothetical protein [Acinetobacter larvae]|uniref:Uncharacterized protein n=1 Tax=Acinetobacter larvae TaxID=1789224 RepID=A0A1B2LZ97_9GAMM|nr:hypothetical protein [Acinetobacter larvae]AOA58270.1 hypothetical protein BFG52_07810 [Acinetobacter larvae]